MRTFVVIHEEEIELTDSTIGFEVGEFVTMHEEGKEPRKFYMERKETQLERSGKNADLKQKFFLKEIL